MKINSIDLILELTKKVQSQVQFAGSLSSSSAEQLNYKSIPKSWSALECIEHLNLCNAFYIEEINACIHSFNGSPSNYFKGSYLGNKFANRMLPDKKMKKIKTFKKVNPVYSEISKEKTLSTFKDHLKELEQLLQRAKGVNMTKLKTKTLVPVFKLRLGNAFQVIIYHNERHIVQAKNMMKNFT